jgi:hypothetical protein
MLSRAGVAKDKASASNPTFGFVFVIPPVWHVPHDVLNSRFPRFTCSGVKTTVFPVPSSATVRVASSRSIAKAEVALKHAKHEILKINDFKNLPNMTFIFNFL